MGNITKFLNYKGLTKYPFWIISKLLTWEFNILLHKYMWFPPKLLLATKIVTNMLLQFHRQKILFWIETYLSSYFKHSMIQSCFTLNTSSRQGWMAFRALTLEWDRLHLPWHWLCRYFPFNLTLWELSRNLAI